MWALGKVACILITSSAKIHWSVGPSVMCLSSVSIEELYNCRVVDAISKS